MKKFFYILFLLISIFTNASFHANGQIVQPDLPMVCDGSVSKYNVGTIYSGFSDFKWRIYHTYNNNQDTIFIKPEHIVLNNRGENIEVKWIDPSYVGGIYTLEVTETNDFGCSGTPYSTDVILNTNTIYIAVDNNAYLATACLGDSAHLDPGIFKYYSWTKPPSITEISTAPIYKTTEAGTYQVRLVDFDHSCTYDTLRAFFNPLPYVWLGNDTILFASQTLTLDATNTDFTEYKWFNNGADLNLSPLTSTLTVDGLSGRRTYKVTVTDFNGCKNSDEIVVDAADMSKLYIPAAFTPNGDMINDVWEFPRSDIFGVDKDLYKYIQGTNVGVDIKVYNRWGKLVWYSPKFKLWDGKDLNGRDLPMDSYHYIIVFDFNGKQYNYKGSVTIIR